MRLTSFVVVSSFVLGAALCTTVAAAQTPTSPPAEALPAPAQPAPAVAAPVTVAPVVAAEGRPAEMAPPHAEPAAEDRSVYLSVSPLHLLLPVVEVTAEIRAHRHVGLALIGGYGQVKVDTVKNAFNVYEIGGQFLGYPVGHFDHGMQLGAEVLYVGVSGQETAGNVKIAAAGNGLAAGPLIGYKLATDVGFSFNIQGGVGYMITRADASSNTGEAVRGEQASLIPLLNINVGWSF